MAWLSLRTNFHKLLPCLTLQPFNRVEETLRILPSGAKICDIGAGGRRITESTYTIDAFVNINTDLVCDVHNIPLPDESFDCIFCTGTLEHVNDPYKVMAEIYRLLRKDGIAHIEAPFIQAYHADPDDYWRWTFEGLKMFCLKAGFSEIYSGVHIGPASSLNWIFNEYVTCFFGKGVFGNTMSSFARVILAPFRYFDYFLIKRGLSKNVASGVYFVGRKRIE